MTVRPDVTRYFIYSPRLECKFDRKNYSRTTGLPSSTFSLSMDDYLSLFTKNPRVETLTLGGIYCILKFII